MENICELHLHTNCSDGKLNVKQLLDRCKQKGVFKISITDHNTFDAYENLKKISKKFLSDFEIIEGVELTSVCNQTPIEILAYNCDRKIIQEFIDEFELSNRQINTMRAKEIPNMIKTRFSVDIDISENNFDLSLSRPDVAKSIFERVVKNKKLKQIILKENKEALDNELMFFRLCLNNPKSAFYYLPSVDYPDYKSVIDIVHKANGLAFLAHPYHYSHSFLDVLNLVKDYVDGIECYHHTTRDKSKSDYLIKFCDEYKLMKSGGSDFHYYDKNFIDIGDLCVPAQYFDEIKNAKKI